MRVAIYLYEEVEILDFAGPFEVFSTASRLCRPDSAFTVMTISHDGAPVLARGGLKVCPDYSFDTHPIIDVLIIPGGVHSKEMLNRTVLDWIARTASTARLVASVCTGAFLLAAAQVVDTHRVTTHWEDIADLRDLFPALDVRENTRWVDQGNIVTSAGISAGIDMSLYLVNRLHSRELAIRTARQMEFDWTQPDDSKGTGR